MQRLLVFQISMRGGSHLSRRSFGTYISEENCLEMRESTPEGRVYCFPGSLSSNNALLSSFFVQLDFAGEESAVDSEVEVHNGFVESKARFEFIVSLSASMDMSVRGYNREDVLALAVVKIGHWEVSEVMV
jgi:hypothetical protein